MSEVSKVAEERFTYQSSSSSIKYNSPHKMGLICALSGFETADLHKGTKPRNSTISHGCYSGGTAKHR